MVFLVVLVVVRFSVGKERTCFALLPCFERGRREEKGEEGWGFGGNESGGEGEKKFPLYFLFFSFCFTNNHTHNNFLQ